jgi:hypothetical protein
MDQIYLKIENKLIELSKRYNNKPKNNFLEKYKTIINKSKKDGKYIKNNKKQKNNKDKDNKKDEVKKDENENQLINKNENQIMTFIEMNNTIMKDSTKHEESLKAIRSKTLFEDGNKNKNEKNLSEITQKNSNENITTQLKSLKKNSKDDLEKDSHKDIEINNNIYKNENVIINFQNQYLIFNNGFTENSLKNNNFNNNTIKKSLTTNVLISHNQNLFRKFVNLTSTKENSIHLNCSYENINKMSNYNYINNINLQNKIKQFINEEFTNHFLSSTHKNIISNICNNTRRKKSSTKVNFERNRTMRASVEYTVDDNKLYKKFNSGHPIKKLTKDVNVLKRNSSYIIEKDISSFRRNGIGDFNSYRNYKMNSFLSPLKSKKKSINKKDLIGQRLNVISKNIQNANEVIHNPNEFYMNFFNNILRKETFSSQNKGDELKMKKTNQSGFTPTADNAKKNQRSSQIEPK